MSRFPLITQRYDVFVECSEFLEEILAHMLHRHLIFLNIIYSSYKALPRRTIKYRFIFIMKFYIFFVIFIFLIKQSLCNLENDKNSDILRQCLQDNNHNPEISTNELLEKFKNYANWTYEEIPCFARCVVAEKGWFDIDHHRWNKQKIVDDLGENLYNYCRYEFSRPFKNVCTYAFKGLKCLKDAELNVIVTYSHLLECINEKATSMSQLLEYYHFPKGERIPCLFNCFANRAQLYDNNNEWIIKNWLKAFGPPRNVNMSNVAVCRVPDERRKTMNVCAWMYEEYNCWERFNYNTNGSVAYRKALRKSNGQKML
ncbi:hypothetical protein CVS40_0252 [Lucilia cuprina]|nr:hypothetical protein CVS40_0252 [Lucilia cuprina]